LLVLLGHLNIAFHVGNGVVGVIGVGVGVDGLVVAGSIHRKKCCI
jgi:hypothetical protein